MDRKTRIILLLAAILIVLTLLFISGSAAIKNSNSADSDTEINRTWTKAICNSDNYCQDYEISCHNNNLVSIKPTGEVVHFSENWKDPRDEEFRKKLC
jgi:hypothetical protein